MTPIIIDNALTKEASKEIQHHMLSADFQWYYNDKVLLLEPDQEFIELYNFQFTHNFMRDGQVNSDWWYLILPLINKIDAKDIIKVKANLNPVADKITQHGLHTDRVVCDTTAVYYVNTNNGMTVFEDGTAVASRANRLLIFDSSLRHTGTTCTDEKVRCVINLNYNRKI